MAYNPHELPFAAYFTLTRFVSRYIQSIDPIDGTGIPGRKLIALCLDADELPFSAGEGKKQVEEGIKRMVREGVLMPVQDTGSGNGSVNRGVGFRLGEGVRVRDVGGDDKENMVPRGGKIGEGSYSSASANGNGYTGVILGEEEGESPAGGGMKGGREGYTHMRSFTPPAHSSSRFESSRLEESDAESDPATAWNPKRRKRQEEIAESNASTRNETVSPSREYDGDTPKREMKRVKGNWEESDPDADADADADIPRPSFEDEQRKRQMQNASPAVVSLFHEFQAEFPNDEFEIDGAGKGFICVECNGKPLTAIRRNFVRHLEGKAHLQMKQNRARGGEPLFNKFMPTSRASLGGYSSYSMGPPEPVAVYSMNGAQQPSIQEARAIYLKSLETDAETKNIRITLVEKRVAGLENFFSGLSDKFESLSKQTGEDIEQINDNIKIAQEQTSSEVQDLHITVDSAERRTKDRLESVVETLGELKKADGEYETAMFDMQKSVQESLKKSAEFTEETRTKVVNQSGKLSKLDADTKESLEGITERLGKIEKDKSERVRKLADRVDRSKERIVDLEGEQSRHKKAIAILKPQGEIVTELEANFQMLGDELKKCRTNDESTKEYNERTEKYLKDLKGKVAALEILIEENQRGKSTAEETEKLTTERFATMEKQWEAKLATIQEKSDKDMHNLVVAMWEQKDKFDVVEDELKAQKKNIATQTLELEGYELKVKKRDAATLQKQEFYEKTLKKYEEQINLQNQIIKVHRNDLAWHANKIKEQDKKLTDQAKRLEIEEKNLKHTSAAVTEFMKDIKMVDDKVEELIDANAFKEAAKAEKELQRKERLEEQKKEMAEGKNNRRSSSISRPALKRLSMNPRTRTLHPSKNSRRTTMG